jgi:hypothetical protein
MKIILRVPGLSGGRQKEVAIAKQVRPVLAQVVTPGEHRGEGEGKCGGTGIIRVVERLAECAPCDHPVG